MLCPSFVSHSLFGGAMKTYLLNKFETVFNDLRAFIVAQVPEKKPVQNEPPKIQEPKRPRQNTPQRAITKKKTVSSRNKSMSDSQGITSFKGSGYKGKGSVDSSKHTANRKRR